MNPKPERSRLGELLLDMRLIDEETLRAALVDQQAQGKRLPVVLAQRGVLDEERLTKAVAARLGLEAVSVSAHKIHERVLALIPYAVSKKYGLLPIAIKRTQQAEVLYLIMIDPLNAEALGEVQRITGRQVRVLMCSATELDQAIDTQYKGLEARLAASRPPRPASIRPTPAQAPLSAPPAPAAARTPLRRGVSAISARARPGSAVARPAGAPVPSRATPPPLMPQKGRPSPSRPGDVRTPRPPAAPAPVRSRTPLPNIAPPVPVAPLVAPPVPLAPPPIVPVETAPAPGDSVEIHMATPVDLVNPATLIDSARPPELEELSRRFVGGKWETMAPQAAAAPDLGPVVPSPLDPPDAVSTRVEEEPPRVLGMPTRPAPVVVAPAQLAQVTPAPFPAVSPAPAPAASQAAKDGVNWDLEGQDWSAEAVWSGLDVADSGPTTSEGSDSVLQEDQWSQATGLDLQEPAGMDGPEEIPTSQLELSQDSKAALLALPVEELSTAIPAASAASVIPAPAPSTAAPIPVPPFAPPAQKVAPSAQKVASAQEDRRLLARTLEVPVELDDGDNPFGDPNPNAVRAGLERTGIFPAIDFDDDEFDPSLAEDGEHLGLSDIPEAREPAKVRFGGAQYVADEDAIEAIEEVLLDPIEEVLLDPIEEVLLDPIDVEDSVDLGSMELPTVERPSPMAIVDEVLAPAVEPRPEPAKPRPSVLPKRAPAPAATLVFDETHERKPSSTESAEEPTNPRMEAPDVVPSSKRAPQVRLPTLAPVDHEGSEEPTPARETVDRAEVLSALEGAFVQQAHSVPTPVSPAIQEARDDTPAAVPEARDDTPASSREDVPSPSRDDTPTASREAAAAVAKDPRPAAFAVSNELPVIAPASSVSESQVGAKKMVAGLLAGTSLDSSERAQMVLAIGRLMLSKGLLSEEELVVELCRDV